MMYCNNTLFIASVWQAINKIYKRLSLITLLPFLPAVIWMNNKTALVTGGTSGIGNAIVRLFIQNGWNVATCGRNTGVIARMQSELGDNAFLGLTADIRLENHVANILEETRRRFGGIDVCVLNAGTLGPAPLPAVLDTDLLDLRRTYETNVFANFNMLKKVTGILRLPGLIVHITSDAAVQPYPGWGAYGSSKAAMRQLVEVLREESRGTGLKAINFDPGDVDTEMHALAIPDADRNALRKTTEVALELYAAVLKELGVNR